MKAIVCTSTSCMDYLERPANVRVLPINVFVDGRQYADGRNITVNGLAQKLINNPKANVYTSAPDEGQLIEFFYELLDEGINEILVIPLSSHLSLTYQHTKNIQAIFGDKLTIHLFDSRNIQQGEAVLVCEAAHLLEQGKDFDEICHHLERIRKGIHLYITVDNLNAMIKTKKVSAPAGWIANLLDIKPIVAVQPDGQLVGYEKVRNFENSLHRLIEIAANLAKNKQGAGKIYVGAYNKNPYLPTIQNLLTQFGLYDIPLFPLSSATIANIGVYTVGIMFVEHSQSTLRAKNTKITMDTLKHHEMELTLS